MSDDARDEFLVRFWGVRGSIATPGAATMRYGGNTSCIEVRCGPHLLIFDAGTGIRSLGSALRSLGPIDADLFFTHTHFDHVVGLPFFKPAFDKRNTIRLWAGHLKDGQTLRTVLCELMMAPLFPIPPSALCACDSFIQFSSGETVEPKPGICIRTGPLNHPNGATGYRIEFGGRSLAIITDTEHFPDRPDENVLSLARGADLMVYDGMYSDETYQNHVGWGHSTWQEACRVAERAGVGQAVVFHHEPDYTDDQLDRIAAAAAEMRPGTLIAREDLVLNL